MRMVDQRKFCRGFTLIELLVVVAIITLLVALLMPALAGAREQAKRTSCGSNIRQIGIAMLMYESEYRKFPARDNTGNGNNRPCYVLQMLYDPYLQNPKAFVCPSNYEHRPDPSLTPDDVKIKWQYLTDNTRQSYGFHFRAIGHVRIDNTLDSGIRWKRTRLADFPNPAEMVMFTDSQERSENNWGNYVISCPTWGEKPGTRHKGGANAVFMDGHVQWGIRPKTTSLFEDSSLPWRYFHPMIAAGETP